MGLKAEKIRRSMPDYKKILELYKESFPKLERFPAWLLRIMSHFKGINSFAFYNGGTLCGFIYFIENENTVFILFLAVNTQIRSKGIGSKIITWIKNYCPNKTIFLDAEKPDNNAPNNPQRLRRIEFYKRNGIFDTGNFFADGSMVYEILSTDKTFSKKDYDQNLASFFNIFKKKKQG